MSTGQAAIEALIAALPEGTKTSIDPPKHADGVWHLDVTIDGRMDPITWYPGRGYGLYSDNEPDFGVNPDIWESEPGAAAARHLALVAAWYPPQAPARHA